MSIPEDFLVIPIAGDPAYPLTPGAHHTTEEKPAPEGNDGTQEGDTGPSGPGSPGQDLPWHPRHRRARRRRLPTLRRGRQRQDPGSTSGNHAKETCAPMTDTRPGGPVHDAARQAFTLAGGAVDVDLAIAAMLDAVVPQIQAEFAQRLAEEFERMIETGLLVDPLHNEHQFPAERDKRKRMHDALWERAAETAYAMVGRSADRQTPADQAFFEDRVGRQHALTDRLYRAVFANQGGAERALNDPRAHLRIELLRGVLLGADHAMRAQGIDRRTRDLVAHQIIFGDPPKDPTATPDEQIDQALTEEQARHLQRLQADARRPQWPSDPLPTHQE